jgi:hypothetical protein
MKLKIILFLLLSVIPVFANPQKKNYIGYKHKGVVYGATLPNGAKDLGGGLLSDNQYGVTRFKKGAKDMLWLEKIAGRDEEGVPTWLVMDVLMFDALKNNQKFLLSYSSSCMENGKENLDLIVFAELSANRKSYKILNAWRADLNKEKFEKAETTNILCEVIAR